MWKSYSRFLTSHIEALAVVHGPKHPFGRGQEDATDHPQARLFVTFQPV